MASAVVVLAAFVANQWFRLRSDAVAYLILNAFGTAVLATVAGLNGDLGFLLLEGVWAAVSTIGLVRAVRGRAESHPTVTTD